MSQHSLPKSREMMLGRMRHLQNRLLQEMRTLKPIYLQRVLGQLG